LTLPAAKSLSAAAFFWSAWLFVSGETQHDDVELGDDAGAVEVLSALVELGDVAAEVVVLDGVVLTAAVADAFFAAAIFCAATFALFAALVCIVGELSALTLFSEFALTIAVSPRTRPSSPEKELRTCAFSGF
jgi:hypothetical protein